MDNAIQQWKTMGRIPVRSFITRVYSATVLIVSIYMENMLTVRSSPLSAFTLFISDFIHQRHVKSILFITMQEVPLLFLAPKDNNDFSHCSFIRKVPPTPYHPSCG